PALYPLFPYTTLFRSKNHRAHDDLVLRLRPQEGERSARPADGARSRPEATWLAARTEPGQFPEGTLQPAGDDPSSPRACVEVLRDRKSTRLNSSHGST